jgi:branched-chain amino acid transport system permease protein
MTLIDIAVTASFYLLLALGFNIVARTSGVLNLAQGQFAVVGGLLLSSIVGWLGRGFQVWLGIPLTFGLTLALGFGTYYLFMRKAYVLDHWTLLVITLAIGIMFDAVIALIWGSQPYYIKGGVPTGTISIAGTRTQTANVVLWGVAIFVLLSLALLVSRSRWGAMGQAVTDNPELAASRGINVNLVMAVSWGLCFAISALVGSFFAALNGIDASATTLGLSALPAIMLGGLGSISGSVVGSVALATVVTEVTLHGGPIEAEIVSYGVLLAVLLVKPRGLFGARHARSV